MSVEAALSLFAAWRASSPALLAFGRDSAIEFLSAVVVLWRFRLTASEQHAEHSTAIYLVTVPRPDNTSHHLAAKGGINRKKDHRPARNQPRHVYHSEQPCGGERPQPHWTRHAYLGTPPCRAAIRRPNGAVVADCGVVCVLVVDAGRCHPLI